VTGEMITSHSLILTSLLLVLSIGSCLCGRRSRSLSATLSLSNESTGTDPEVEYDAVSMLDKWQKFVNF